MAISKSTQDYDYEFLDLSDVNDYERDELKSTLYDSENKIEQKAAISEVPQANPTNPNRYEASSNNYHKNNNNRKDPRGGTNYSRTYQTNHYQNYYQHNRNYQSQDGNSQGNQNDDGSISLKNNNRQKPNTWSNKPRKYHHPGGGQQQQQQQTQLRNTSFQQYHQSGDYQTSPSIDKQRPQNLVPPQRPPSASSSNNYRGNNNNNSNNTNPRRQRQQEPLREGSGTTSRNPHHHHHHHHQDQKSGYGGTGIRLGPARRTNSLNSCYSTTTETGSIENSGSWNDEDSHAHVLSENVETDSTVQVSTTPTSVAIVSSATDQVSQSSSPPASATGVIATTNMNSTNPAGVGQGSLPTVGQQPGMPATNVGQQAGHGGIPPHGAPVFAAPMQYPTAMYPTMQMLQPTGPSNVYVGNVTANVSVHGYMHMQPHYPMPTVTTAGAPGNYMPTASDMGVVQGTVAPIDNQGQQQNQRHGGGGNNRRGRGRTSSGSSGPRRDYTPRPNSQQDHLAAAQPGMLEQQQPHLMTAAPAAGYTQYFMPYSPYYQHQTIAPGVGHPAAQHATGHPLYLSPMPMYGGAAAAIGYGYPPGSVLYSVLPESYALPVEDKPEEVPQEVPQPMWSPQPSEHQQFQAPPPQQLQAQPQQVQQPDEIVSIETGIPEDYQEESGSQLDENTVNVNLQQPPPQIHHQTTPPQMMHHPHVLNPNVPNFIVPQPQEVMQGPIPAHFAQPPPALPADFQPVSLSPVSSYDHQNFVPPPPKTFTLDQPPPPLPSAEEVLPIVDVNGVPPPIIVANSVPPAFKQVPPVPIALDQCIALPPTNVTSSTHISEIITLPVNTVNPTIVAIPNQNVPKTVNKEDASVNKVIKATEKVTITKTDRFGGASNRPVAWNKKQTTSVSVSAIPAKETPKVSQPAYPNVSQKTVHPQPTAKPETKEKEVVKRESKEITANTKSPQPPPISLAPPPPPIEEQKSTPSQSWASLFSSSSAPKMPTNMAVAEPSKKPVAKVSPFDSNPNQSHTASIAGKTAEKKPIANEWSLKQADFLQKYKIDNNSISIFPRGLINRSNYCYINAILQALVSCPPFYHLMRDMPKPLPAYKARGSTPIIDAMQELMFEFTPRKIIKEKGSNIELITDTAFEPIVIYKMLSGIRSDIFQVEGRQEDAEEFLGCILNRLNDEMLELIKLIDTKIPTNNNNSMSNNNNKLALSAAQKKEENPTSMLNGTAVVDQNGDQTTDTDGDDWQVIGSRNKGTVTRTTDFGRTPISDIFRGKLRSRVHREGDHATDNIQPFFTLQLDIERATSVRDALELLVGRDPLEGVTSSKTNQEVTAWQQVTIEELPVVLVLHLKCFDYKMEGCTKILKTLEYSTDLKIDQKLLSSKTKYTMPRQRTYKLFAVVYHDGKEASKGHYLTDAFHIGYGSWIRYDDSMVSLIPESKVLAPVSPRVPYLLYYRRYDTINNNANNNNNSSNNMSNNNSSNNNNMSGNGTSNNGNASNNGNNSNTLNTNNTNNTYSNYHQRNNYHK